MFTRQVKLIKQSAWQPLRFIAPVVQQRSEFNRGTGGTDDDTSNKTGEEPKLKKWRDDFDYGSKFLLSKLKALEPSGQPQYDFIAAMNRPWNVSIGGLQKWWGRRKLDAEIVDQRFIKERHTILGANLAAAHFIVYRGGRVKFVGREEWVMKQEDDEYDLPKKFAPNYIVEAIDASHTNILYEGLVNLEHLHELRWLSFKGCPHFDDWCVDRISSLYPKLEHLDISDCENVTERALEALYRMHSLKKLIITNWHNSAALELTCLMLEDCLPKLYCEIRHQSALPTKEAI